MHPPPPPAPAPIDRGMPAAAADGALPEATGKDDVEASPAACCRICLQPDCARGDELISPCRCKGTQQFVHRTCLDHWRAVKEGTAFSHCTTCEAQFYLRVEFREDDVCRRMKFQLFVARDVFLIFLAIQAVIGTIAGVTYLLDRDGKFRNRFADSGDHILPKHPVLFYYCVGVVVLFALIGLCGLLLHCFSANTDPSCLVGCSYECVECLVASALGGGLLPPSCYRRRRRRLRHPWGHLRLHHGDSGLPEHHAAPLPHPQQVGADKGVRRGGPASGLRGATQHGPGARAAPEDVAAHVGCCGHYFCSACISHRRNHPEQ